MPKRILKELVIDEISAVDRPAQAHARSLIMKRAEKESGAPDTGELAKKFLSSPEGQKFLEALIKNAAQKGGKDEVQEITMPNPNDAATLEAVEKKLNEAEAKLAKAEAFGKLTDVEKAHYASLDDSAKAEFLSKSDDQRKAVIAKAQEEDAVVYKSLSGDEYRKSDDERLVKMAKQADEDRKALLKAQAAVKEAEFQKRAADLQYLPGKSETHVAILKALDSIEDESIRKDALEVLKSKNQSNSQAFETNGHQIVSKAAGEADKELEELAKKYAAEKGVDFFSAYEAVSAQRPDLLAKAVQH